MIINEIMKKMRSSQTIAFEEAYRYYNQFDRAYDVYKALRTNMECYHGKSSEFYRENIICSSGCKNKIAGTTISGCTFCNWENESLYLQAGLRVLRKKSEELYVKLVVDELKKQRSGSRHPAVIEEIASPNVFDEEDFTDSLFNSIFLEDKLWEGKPMYGILAVRAEDITSERVKKWKQQFRKNLIIGFGVEVKSEWVRNHWLNKNLTNATINRAIATIHNNGCIASCNVLMGIPGFSTYNSLHEFIDTCEWLAECGADTILVSPLVMKEGTMQHYIHNKMNNTFHHKLTGILDPIEVMFGIYWAVVRNPELANKIQISPQNGKEYMKQFDNLAIQDNIMYNCLNELIEYNEEHQGIKFDALLDTMKKGELCNEYHAFMEKMELEKKVNVKENLDIVAKELISSICVENACDYREKFESELRDFKCGD